MWMDDLAGGYTESVVVGTYKKNAHPVAEEKLASVAIQHEAVHPHANRLSAFLGKLALPNVRLESIPVPVENQ